MAYYGDQRVPQEADAWMRFLPNGGKSRKIVRYEKHDKGGDYNVQIVPLCQPIIFSAGPMPPLSLFYGVSFLSC